jgi:hypothetical protein
MLARMDAPLRGMDDSLKNIQDNLEGAYLHRTSEAQTKRLQCRSARESFAGSRLSHTKNTTTKLLGMCFQALGSGFCPTLYSRSGRMKAHPPSCGSVAYRGLARANSCKC